MITGISQIRSSDKSGTFNFNFILSINCYVIVYILVDNFLVDVMFKVKVEKLAYRINNIIVFCFSVSGNYDFYSVLNLYIFIYSLTISYVYSTLY